LATLALAVQAAVDDTHVVPVGHAAQALLVRPKNVVMEGKVHAAQVDDDEYAVQSVMASKTAEQTAPFK